MFLYRSYFPFDRQNGTQFSKSNRKGKEFEYNFLIICRYLNLVKKSEDIFIVIAN